MINEQRDLPWLLEENGRDPKSTINKQSEYDTYSEIEDRFINKDDILQKRQNEHFRMNTMTYRDLETAQ